MSLRFGACVLECGGRDTAFASNMNSVLELNVFRKRCPPKAFGVATALQDLAAIRTVRGNPPTTQTEQASRAFDGNIRNSPAILAQGIFLH